jgi:hypothetical protein
MRERISHLCPPLRHITQRNVWSQGLRAGSCALELLEELAEGLSGYRTGDVPRPADRELGVAPTARRSDHGGQSTAQRGAGVIPLERARRGEPVDAEHFSVCQLGRVLAYQNH